MPQQIAPAPEVRRSLFPLPPTSSWLILSALVLVFFLLIPVVGLILRGLPTLLLGAPLLEPLVLDALRLSLLTTFLALALSVLLGTPVAYLLARHRFWGRNLLDTLLDVPMVLPPAVAGVALLTAFGRRGLLGPWLEALGLTLAFSTAAVVMAQTFVAAPFYIKAAKSGFEGVDVSLERVSTTLGVSGWRTFWRITVPLALPSLLGGAVMTWARALGEFGATLMFAGNFQGRTQTMPLAILTAMETDLNAALALSLILVVISFGTLLLLKVVAARAPGGLYA